MAAVHVFTLLCGLILTLTAAAPLEDVASCDSGDQACSAQMSSGAALMQIDRTHKKPGPGSDPGNQKLTFHPKTSAVSNHDQKPATKDFEGLAERAATTGFCKSHPCNALLSGGPGRTLIQEKSTTGKTAALSQSGYAQVAAVKSDAQMKEYILRVIDKYDCKVTNEGGLNGIVPWFSGTTMVQDLPKLEDTLLFAVLSTPSWLSYKNSDRITGDTAAKSFIGYVQVAAMKSTAEMKKFVRRVCADMGVKVVNEGGFEGMVKYYSGAENFQSFERLQSEIKSAANAPHSWAQWEKTPSKETASPKKKALLQEGAVTETGFARLAKRAIHGFCIKHPCRMLRDAPALLQLPEGDQKKVSQLAITKKTITKHDDDQDTSSSASHQDFARSSSSPNSPSRLSSQSTSVSREQLSSNSSSNSSSRSSSNSLGKRAALDQSGYAQVAALKDDIEMKEFVLRVVEKYDCRVNEMGGLMGIVPWFSGTTSVQDMTKLEDTLLFAVLSTSNKPWLSYKNSDHITGDTAKLGFVGYVQVAAMRNDYEMKKFARRLCHDMGVEIVDEGGFEGTIKYYSGTNNFQSFERLQNEIKSAANAPHSWANWIGGKAPKEKK